MTEPTTSTTLGRIHVGKGFGGFKMQKRGQVSLVLGWSQSVLGYSADSSFVISWRALLPLSQVQRPGFSTSALRS